MRQYNIRNEELLHGVEEIPSQLPKAVSLLTLDNHIYSICSVLVSLCTHKEKHEKQNTHVHVCQNACTHAHVSTLGDTNTHAHTHIYIYIYI